MSARSAFAADPSQRAVIEAAPTAFLQVAAPPGAGKTAVACARIAWLVAQGVAAPAILMLSFTRVAVAEFRDRLARIADDDPEVRGVEVTTLDAQTWRVLRGLGDGGTGTDTLGDFDFDIAALLQRLAAREPAMLDWFGGFRHILVDEAQDLVGPRAELVATLLALRHPECGATVFADDAQAIYSFTAGEGEDAANATTLAAALAARGLAPTRHELTTIHRTDDPALQRLFLAAREPIATSPGAEALEAVRALVRASAHEDLGDWDDALAGLDGLPELLLTRSRLQALRLSQVLQQRRRLPHRLRMSGMPQGIEPWIGRVLATTSGRKLEAATFHELWRRHADEPCLRLQPRTVDGAWRQLLDLADDGRGRVDLHRLRRLLARRRPPVAVAIAAPGSGGLTIGTIHAAKGREAARVTLCLDDGSPAGDDDALREEAKVLYVGATRAIERLAIAKAPFAAGGPRLASHRSWFESKGVVQVEIGRDGDLDGPASAARALHGSDDRCAEGQHWLAGLAADATVTLTMPGRGDWDYRIGLDAIRRVGRLTPALNVDLFAIAKESKWLRGRRPPELIRGAWCCGATTVCLAPDDPRLGELCAPHDASGFLLAPVLRGLVEIHFDLPVKSNSSW